MCFDWIYCSYKRKPNVTEPNSITELVSIPKCLICNKSIIQNEFKVVGRIRHKDYIFCSSVCWDKWIH